MARIAGCLVVLSLVLHLASGTCLPGFAYIAEANKCIHTFTSQGTWIQARQICMANDGDLLTLKSASFNPISGPGFIQALGDIGMWIGLNDRNLEGVYRWNNEKENATYFNWAPNQPLTDAESVDTDCVALEVNGDTIQWFNRKCSTRKYFVCERMTNEDFAVYKAENADRLNVPCPGEDWTQVPNRRMCIQMQNQKKRFLRASEKCSLGSEIYDTKGKYKLLNVADFEINDFVKGKFGRENHWISANDLKTEGKYQDDFTYEEGSEYVTYLPWKPGTVLSEFKDCVLISRGNPGDENKMIEDFCADEYPFICEYTPLDPVGPTSESREKVCPEGWSKYAPLETCFKAMDVKKMMWHSAREECQALDSDLAIIPNQDTLEFLKGIVTINRYWIGLTDKEKNGKFSWLGQDAETEFEAWRNRPRNLGGDEYCVELIGAKEGQWNDKSCKAKKHFICQKPATLAED